MGSGRHLMLLLFFVILSLLQAPALATKKSYVVYLGSHQHGAEATDADFDRVTETHHEFLGSYLGSIEKAKEAMIYSYTRHINGFAAMLRDEEAAEIAKHPKVVSVFLNRGRKLHTTHSWEFMVMEKPNDAMLSDSIFGKGRYGEDTIVAHLDTGVWPEAESFSDDGLGPIPSRWKGTCDTGVDGFNCNRKLIGARYFNKGYASYVGAEVMKDPKLNTARDFAGHGTHTLSTMGGNRVHGVNVYGFGNGTASGGSPRARVATYKVCWAPVNGSECFDVDILAAFDMAIHDGVQVLSVSLGGDPADYFEDGLSIGAFHAVSNGIPVVCSAGNSGPNPGTVSNLAPWILTVAASTLDRQFHSVVELANGLRFSGESLSNAMPEKKFYPMISAAYAKLDNATAENAILCKEGTIDPEKAGGKILVCLRGEIARVEKSYVAMKAGAAGMILCNDKSTGDELIADPHFVPSSQITYEDGVAVFAYVNSTQDPLGYILPPETKLQVKPAPHMAFFSSVGPNTITPEILKPDVTAPGVNIIAAYSEGVSPTEMSFDHRRVPFIVMSGTSMSCPHVAGIAGLLRTMYPHWSPSAIKSAIMTSARTRDNDEEPILDGFFHRATPFDYGFGHIRPNRAMDPGLVYDMTTNDYFNFMCAIGYNETQITTVTNTPYACRNAMSILDVNYPSITVPELFGSVTVKRRVKNVGSPGTYFASFHNPSGGGLSISVSPKVLKFDKVGEEKSFEVTLKVARPGTSIVFAGLTWSDGKHYVRSPIVVGGIHA